MCVYYTIERACCESGLLRLPVASVKALNTTTDSKRTFLREESVICHSCAATSAAQTIALFCNRDELAVLDEFHLAVLKGEEGEIAAEANVLAGADLRAALADDDGAGLEELTVVSFDAEILRVGIAAVASRCGSSHFLILLTRLP